MKLYHVTTVTGEYAGCKNVRFRWFYNGKRKDRRPYIRLIRDHIPGELYAEGAIDEMFTLLEANALKDYLDRVHGDHGVTTVTEAELPIDNNIMGVGAVPVGGGNDFYMLHEEEPYSLPFKVRGYFDLRGLELADGSGEVFHHYCIRLGPDGPRRETQEEARECARSV